MSPDTAIRVAQALIGAVPRIADLVARGRKLGSIRIDELISEDAVEALQRSLTKARDFVERGL
jgi:hypothetical protein